MAERKVSRSVVVVAPAARIFAILASPRRHPEFDGSGTVRGAVQGPDRLTPNARFGMDMRIGGVDYRTGNRVVEFEENRLIAWRHGGGPHRWRWTLDPDDNGGDGVGVGEGGTVTRVTETFDYSGPWAVAYVLLGYPARNARAIERTLPRLKSLAERAETDR